MDAFDRETLRRIAQNDRYHVSMCASMGGSNENNIHDMAHAITPPFDMRRRRRRRGWRKTTNNRAVIASYSYDANRNMNMNMNLASREQQQQSSLSNVINCCRGGGDDIIEDSSSSIPSSSIQQQHTIKDHSKSMLRNHPSIAKATTTRTAAIIPNANDIKTKLINQSSNLVRLVRLSKANHNEFADINNSNMTDNNNSQEQTQMNLVSRLRPRIVIEFETAQSTTAGENNDSSQQQHYNTIRYRIQNRIGNEKSSEELLPKNGLGRPPTLSISFEANVHNPSSSLSIPTSSSSSSQYYTNDRYATELIGNINNNNNDTLVQNLLSPTKTTTSLLLQTLSLLPTLLVSRRILNTTWTVIVDYIRGRTIRTKFTRLERVYLRYYEFPAVIRAMARLGSQLCILLGLNWCIRWWMIWVVYSGSGSVDQQSILGVTGIRSSFDSIGMIGTTSPAGSGKSAVIDIFPNVVNGLPSYLGSWLFDFIWIGSVVGIGHAAAMALSVWGGPLRLQASQQQQSSSSAMNNRSRHNVLRRIIIHPIEWVKELEEWKYLSALYYNSRRRRMGMTMTTRRRDQRSSYSRVGAGEEGTTTITPTFNPDPLLFPATWMPLRWLQIFAICKAFSTDPLQYRWCSPDNDKIVIPRLMKQYLIQLALGDEWQRVFLGEKRVGLGILVIFSYFVSLVWMICTTFTLDGGAVAMLIPSVLAAIISGFFNVVIFWNRLGSREQRKMLNNMGLL